MSTPEDPRETLSAARRKHAPSLAKAFTATLHAHRAKCGEDCGTRAHLEDFERNLAQAIKDSTGLLAAVDSSSVAYKHGANTWASIELCLEDGTVLNFQIVEASNGKATNGSRT